jgi:hypothetical protein
LNPASTGCEPGCPIPAFPDLLQASFIALIT